MIFERLTFRQLVGLDCLAVVAFLLVAMGPGSSGPWRLALAAAALPVAVRRIWPVPVLLVVVLATVVSVGFEVRVQPFFAVAFALYAVAVAQPPRRWVPTRAIGVLSGVGLVAAAVSAPVGSWAASVRADVGALVLGLSVAGGGWVLGRAVRERREYAARAAEQLAERAVTEERLRIARELHDVVAHSMSLITVKAGVAAHVAPTRPEEVVDALRVIEQTSRGALGEMRHVLDVLRSSTSSQVELVPAPGMSSLPELVSRAGMAGVRVSLEMRGVSELPDGVELSVYRIVQEAVTNVVKHAAPARCLVRVSGSRGEVRIEVTDDGPGVRVLPDEQGAGGHGLIGMRERIAMYGGEFAAGPLPAGGFGVSARLPYESAR